MSITNPRFASLWLIAVAAVTTAAQAALPTEIHIPGEKVVPESLTSTRDGTIFIGSILERTIFKVKPGADTAEAWIRPGAGKESLQNILGVFADERSRTLWACSTALVGEPQPNTPQSELFAFDLKTGAVKGRYALPTTGAFCNDIAVGADGTAYVSDTANMEIAALKHGATQLEAWSPGGAFGPKGGVLDGISVLNKTVFVNALRTNKVFSVAIGSDGKAGTVAEIKLDRAIEHPDGMRAFGKDSVLIIEGGEPGRLSRIDLSAGAGKVTTLKEGYPDGPVSVAVVGETAYVLEAQFKMLKPPEGYKPNPFHATAVHVGRP
jgi:sugar lactone lactonase YvrE